MKNVLALFFILLVYSGCSNGKSKGSQQVFLKNDTVVSRYISHSTGDSTTKIFEWSKVNDLRIVAGGDVKFIFQKDGTIRKISSRNQIDTLDYIPFKMTDKQKAKIATKLIGDKFELLGIYEDETAKNSGLYFAFYRYKNYIFMQCHETIGFLVGIVLFSQDQGNPFKENGVVFPYSNKIMFER